MKRVTAHLFFFLILLALSFFLYQENLKHEFHLDSQHSIVKNPSVQNLQNIPKFFLDPGTFSTLRTNIDYRPVLQTSYALNYALGEYSMPIWHYTQIGIHALCAIFLFLFAHQLAIRGGYEEREALLGAGLAATFFTVHPTYSGVVNYLSARSSSLTGVFLLSSFYLYLKSDSTPVRLGAWALFTLALFTKVEAVAALAVYLVLDLWKSKGEGDHLKENLPRLWSSGRLRLLPLWLGTAVAYVLLRHVLMKGYPMAAASVRPGMNSWNYLATQTTAWWFYILKWFAPLNLVADNTAYPVYWSFLAPTVLLALGGWLFLLVWSLSSWQKTPQVFVLGLSYIALLSPTSSLVPLSEMVNEHRPYLPLAILSLLWLLPLGRLILRRSSLAWRISLSAACLLWLCGFAGLTAERNKVFLSSESFWQDVVQKSPSGRAHVNYGLTFLSNGDFVSAQTHFEKAVELTPQYEIAHINLAIANENLGDLKAAQLHYDTAVSLDKRTGVALIWRGRWHLKRQQFESALQDFQAASAQSLDDYALEIGFAQSYLGLHRSEEAAKHTLAAGALNMPQLSIDIVQIASPAFQAGHEESGLLYFEQLQESWPKLWWISANRAELLEKLGRHEEAKEARRQSESQKG